MYNSVLRKKIAGVPFNLIHIASNYSLETKIELLEIIAQKHSQACFRLHALEELEKLEEKSNKFNFLKLSSTLKVK